MEIKNKIMECIVGSTLYNLNTRNSDIDKSGLFILDKTSWVTLFDIPQEIKITDDHKFYELKKFILLACKCNPNILDLLYVPKDFILYDTYTYDYLRNYRKLFLTKNCFSSYTGYAYAQIKKAKGQNKKVHKAETWLNQDVLNDLELLYQNKSFSEDWLNRRYTHHLVKYLKNKYGDCFNTKSVKECDDFVSDKDSNSSTDSITLLMRPIVDQFIHTIGRESADISPMKVYSKAPVSELFNLDNKDCSAITHLPNCYNVFSNGSGMIKDNQIACSSIIKDRVAEDYTFSVFYNKEFYEKSVKEYMQFWEWYCNRNVDRWKTQLNNSVQYDSKNLMHTFRLLAEGNNIITHGRPLIKMTGKLRSFLMGVRNAKYDYEYLLDKAQDEMTTMRENFKNSDLPEKVNMKKVNKLYQTCMDMGVVKN